MVKVWRRDEYPKGAGVRMKRIYAFPDPVVSLLLRVTHAFLDGGGLGRAGQRLAILADGLGFAGGFSLAFLDERGLRSTGQRFAVLADRLGLAVGGGMRRTEESERRGKGNEQGFHNDSYGQNVWSLYALYDNNFH